MTKGDIYTKEIIKRILEEGTLDENSNLQYEDGTPAHSLSVSHGMCTYDLTKGESPLITLSPITIKNGIGEILWIYRDASNNIYDLERKYGIKSWRKYMINPHFYDEKGVIQRGHNPYEGYYYDSLKNKMQLGEKSLTLLDKDFDLKHNIIDSNTGDVITPKGTIGACYGYTVRTHHQFLHLIDGIQNNPFGRHIMNLWQEDDLRLDHGLKPSAFLTEWNVRKKDDEYFLDMKLTQNSGDIIAQSNNYQTQYLIFLCMVAKHLGMTPGKFSLVYNSIQIYDRNIEAAKEILEREPVDCNPTIDILNENIDVIKVDEIKVRDYPVDEIAKKNKQLKLELVI